MSAADDQREGGLTGVWIGWAIAFAIPLVLGATLSGRTFSMDDSGSCSSLTDAGRAAYDDAVLPLQVALGFWVLSGAVLLWLEWSDHSARERRVWVVAGWWPPALAVTGYCVLAPTTNELMAFVAGVLMALGAAAWALLLLAPAVAKAGPGGAKPWALWCLSPLYLAGAVLIGGLLGGTGEVPIC
jgi:hypothetical protein